MSSFCDTFRVHATQSFVIAVTWDTTSTSYPCVSPGFVLSESDSAVRYFSNHHSMNCSPYNSTLNPSADWQFEIAPSIVKQGESISIKSAVLEKLTVFDITGRIVSKLENTNKKETLSISTAGWIAGLYFCHAEGKNGLSISKKIVVQ